MNFYSTNKKAPIADLKEVVFLGTAPDGGLYMPENIPQLPHTFFDTIDRLSFQEIAFEVLKPFFTGQLSEQDLHEIIEDAINFETPAVHVHDSLYSLELFHGPTLAFKDVGARFMARLSQKLLGDFYEHLNILVATSGDTGSAVANGFLGVDGIDVTVLYPKGKVSLLQEKQFTTLGQNITAIEVDGSFDDCQSLVKKAFADTDLRKQKMISSANSINVARFLPQSIYYFYAYAQLKNKDKVIFSVPSGNFGNLTAGLVAKRMGLPVHKFIAATNINDIVPHYLDSGVFEPKASISTLSNAMDVGNPSNFARMLDLYNHDLQAMKKDILGAVYTDAQVVECITQVEKEYGYLLDPHGAISYMALRNYLKENEGTGLFLETAHPAKFLETCEKATGKKVTIPQRLQNFMKKEKQTQEIEVNYKAFREFLLEA